MIYFDNAATTSVRPEVVSVYTRLLQAYGNPDSLHALGRQTKKQMEESRSRIAKMLKAKDDEILFTSCASESNSYAIFAYALANAHRGKHIISSNAEHSSSEAALNELEKLGFKITRLPITETGTIDLKDLEKALDKETILVSLIHCSNETGALLDLDKAADLTHAMPFAKFHADCTQSFGKHDIPVEKLDFMTMSAHKIHGLKGSALLLARKPVSMVPLIFGGQQEQGLRGGTENAPVHTVLAKTIRLALDEKEDSLKTVTAISDYLKDELSKIDGVHVISPENGSPFIMPIVFDWITSQVLSNALDAKGICVSAKSTCASKDSHANPVLMKMGLSEDQATRNIRLSFSKDNTLEEAREFVKAISEIKEQYGLHL